MALVTDSKISISLLQKRFNRDKVKKNYLTFVKKNLPTFYKGWQVVLMKCNYYANIPLKFKKNKPM